MASALKIKCPTLFCRWKKNVRDTFQKTWVFQKTGLKIVEFLNILESISNIIW